ncbi:MAG: fimbria/pilus outer membrane usher protein [Sulfuritalea sp.]|nr:fimbria/pilus outer membrane usher protein [Sulfuritalea sp.]MDP1983081.1 fimbria/pilus outer membrane usher protein [Sulfuritalea sp.]
MQTLRKWHKVAAGVACALPLAADANQFEPALTLARSLSDESARPVGIVVQSDRGLDPVLALTRELVGAYKAATSPSGQLLIAEISLNGVRKGEFTVMAVPGGDFLVGEPDLMAMGVQPPYGSPVDVEGAAYFSLQGLHASELRFDEGRLALFVTLPPERLPKKALDLQPGRPERVMEPSDDSAFFNYRALTMGGSAGGHGTTTLSTELGVRLGDFLLRSESTHARGAGPGQDIRYGTSLTHDDRRSLRRWTVGDFTATSGDLGGVMNLGGISLSKSYQIDPYFIRQPMAGFTGNVTSPAQAEIYVDGVRVRTEALQPGQFELRNLNYYGGRRDVSVVIRDQLGREQRLVYPFYFTDVNLREGLHEYSYGIGAQRQNLGVASNDYGKSAAFAFHRYGVSDSLTLGGRGEAEPGRHNFGPTLAWRSDRLGILSGSASIGRSPSGSGWAGVARHVFQSRQFSGQVEVRRYSPHYETVGQSAATERPKTDLMAAVSYGMSSIGALSFDWRQLRQHQGGVQRTASLGYSRTLFGSVSVSASISRVSGESASTNVFFAVTYSPRRDFTANFFHDQRGGGTSDVMQFGNNTPVGEGFGYRVIGERSESAVDESRRLAPSLQYNGPHGVYTADLNSTRTAGGQSQEAYQFGVAGGIAYVGGALAFSRPVTDSFGIVKVGELEGVRVYHSAQEIGRTDANGTIFLANLGSYVANRVAIDDRDIPIDYVIANKELNVSPPLRSGSVIRFGVTRIQAITGRLMIPLAGTVQAAEYVDLIVTVDGKDVTYPTGRGGEFYIENLKPGVHSASFVLGQRRCVFDLTVLESTQMLIDLGDIHVCQNDN